VRLRDGHPRAGAGRGDRAGAVRAAGDRDRRVPVARAVPVPRPHLPGAGRAVRRRGLARRRRGDGAAGRRFISPALAKIIAALRAAGVAHFDETGFRAAGKLAWVHSASSGKYVLVTVHQKRGKAAMDAAGVLPSFTGIACHDAWKPYDKYENVAGHALCNAHILRELAAVTETGTSDDVIWARQATEALLALKDAADATRAAGHGAIGPAALGLHSRYFRDAAAAGIVLNAARKTKLQRKRHALATRMRDRQADYLRFANDLRVPFDNNEAEQVIRMGKLRIKVSGSMRSMTGAESFCAIRSYLATAARHGISTLDALTRAAAGTPWIPGTT
jgi:transposase